MRTRLRRRRRSKEEEERGGVWGEVGGGGGTLACMFMSGVMQCNAVFIFIFSLRAF